MQALQPEVVSCHKEMSSQQKCEAFFQIACVFVCMYVVCVVCCVYKLCRLVLVVCV